MQAYRPGIDETLRGDHRVTCRIHGRVGMLTLPETDAPAALHVNRRDHIHVSSGTLNRHANLAQGNEVRAWASARISASATNSRFPVSATPPPTRPANGSRGDCARSFCDV